MNWFDGHSHFFHDGPIYMDRDHVAHLKNPVDVQLARTQIEFEPVDALSNDSD